MNEQSKDKKTVSFTDLDMARKREFVRGARAFALTCEYISEKHSLSVGEVAANFIELSQAEVGLLTDEMVNEILEIVEDGIEAKLEDFDKFPTISILDAN